MAPPVPPEGSGLPHAPRTPSHAAHAPWQRPGKPVPAGGGEGGLALSTHRQLLSILGHVLPEHWMPAAELPPIAPKFASSDPRTKTYEEVLAKTRAYTPLP